MKKCFKLHVLEYKILWKCEKKLWSAEKHGLHPLLEICNGLCHLPFTIMGQFSLFQINYKAMNPINIYHHPFSVYLSEKERQYKSSFIE